MPKERKETVPHCDGVGVRVAEGLPQRDGIGLEDASEPLQASIDRAGDVDQDVYPLLMVPLWALPYDERRAFIERKLPLLPPGA